MPDLDAATPPSISTATPPTAAPNTLTLTSDQAEAAGIVGPEPGSTYELTLVITVTQAGDAIEADIVEARDAIETSTQDEPVEPVTEPPATRPLPSRKGPEAFGMTPAINDEE